MSFPLSRCNVPAFLRELARLAESGEIDVRDIRGPDIPDFELSFRMRLRDRASCASIAAALFSSRT